MSTKRFLWRNLGLQTVFAIILKIYFLGRSSTERGIHVSFATKNPLVFLTISDHSTVVSTAGIFATGLCFGLTVICYTLMLLVCRGDYYRIQFAAHAGSGFLYATCTFFLEAIGLGIIFTRGEIVRGCSILSMLRWYSFWTSLPTAIRLVQKTTTNLQDGVISKPKTCTETITTNITNALSTTPEVSSSSSTSTGAVVTTTRTNSSRNTSSEPISATDFSVPASTAVEPSPSDSSSIVSSSSSSTVSSPSTAVPSSSKISRPPSLSNSAPSTSISAPFIPNRSHELSSPSMVNRTHTPHETRHHHHHSSSSPSINPDVAVLEAPVQSQILSTIYGPIESRANPRKQRDTVTSSSVKANDHRFPLHRHRSSPANSEFEKSLFIRSSSSDSEKTNSSTGSNYSYSEILRTTGIFNSIFDVSTVPLLSTIETQHPSVYHHNKVINAIVTVGKVLKRSLCGTGTTPSLSIAESEMNVPSIFRTHKLEAGPPSPEAFKINVGKEDKYRSATIVLISGLWQIITSSPSVARMVTETFPWLYSFDYRDISGPVIGISLFVLPILFLTFVSIFSYANVFILQWKEVYWHEAHRMSKLLSSVVENAHKSWHRTASDPDAPIHHDASCHTATKLNGKCNCASVHSDDQSQLSKPSLEWSIRSSLFCRRSVLHAVVIFFQTYLFLMGILWALGPCVPSISIVNYIVALQTALESISFCTPYAFFLHSMLALAETESTVQQLILATQKANAEASANESRRRFLRYVFHEVRVPFNSIVLGLEEVAAGIGECSCGIGDNLIETVDQMRVSAEASSSIMNNVLEIGAIEEGRLQLHKGPSDIRALLGSIERQLRPWAAGVHVHLTLDISSGIPALLEVDKTRLGQVITNFTSNALKFVPSDGSGTVVIRARMVREHESHPSSTALPPLPDVSISSSLHHTESGSLSPLTIDAIHAYGTTDDNDGADKKSSHLPSRIALRIEIQDNGVGITPEAQKRLFRPYQQIFNDTNNGGKYKPNQGTGLGLAISREIITKHGNGARIGANSEVGKGSIFWLEIPFDTKEVQKLNSYSTTLRSRSWVAGDTVPLLPSRSWVAGDTVPLLTKDASQPPVATPSSTILQDYRPDEKEGTALPSMHDHRKPSPLTSLSQTMSSAEVASEGLSTYPTADSPYLKPLLATGENTHSPSSLVLPPSTLAVTNRPNGTVMDGPTMSNVFPPLTMTPPPLSILSPYPSIGESSRTDQPHHHHPVTAAVSRSSRPHQIIPESPTRYHILQSLENTNILYIIVDDVLSCRVLLRKALLRRLPIPTDHIIECDHGLTLIDTVTRIYEQQETFLRESLDPSSTPTSSKVTASIPASVYQYIVVLLDGNMPDISGDEAATKLRQVLRSRNWLPSDDHHHRRATPPMVTTTTTRTDASSTSGVSSSMVNDYLPLLKIIGVTGNALQEDTDAFKRAGADEVVTKPVNVDELCALIHDVL